MWLKCIAQPHRACSFKLEHLVKKMWHFLARNVIRYNFGYVSKFTRLFKMSSIISKFGCHKM